MTALLKKDFYMVAKQAWMLLGIAVVFSLIPNFENFGSIYLPVLAMTLPLTTLSYDERCHWDTFLSMTPCRPGTVVLSKYVFTLLLTAAALAATVLIGFVRSAMDGGSYNLAEKMIERTLILAMVVTVNAVSLPAVFRFGAEKGRFIMMAACFGIFALIIGGTQFIGADVMFGWLERIPLHTLGIAAAVVLIAANIVSFFLSVRFYRNRQAGAYD